jgi:hypothetical protein
MNWSTIPKQERQRCHKLIDLLERYVPPKQAAKVTEAFAVEAATSAYTSLEGDLFICRRANAR